MKYQRELTAAVLIPLVLGVLRFGPTWAFSLLVGLATAVALLEFFGLLRAAGWIAPRWVGLGLLLGMVAAAELRSPRGLALACGAALILIPTLVMFASPPEAILLPSSAASAFATLYVGLGAAASVALRHVGWTAVLFLLVIVWAGDSAAYYTGRRWGRKKLAPVVSPKKTWAGLWGQLGAGTVFGAALGISPLSLGLTSKPSSEALLTGVLGLVVSVAAVIGDLVESTFKRSCAVKDSGGLLPGHGGLLDRLDSLLYSAPVLLGLLMLLRGTLLT